MTRIDWDQPGTRLYEAGVDRGVFYPKYGAGVAWPGLVAVNEVVSGGELEALYYDGVKFADVVAAEDFAATVEAFSSPIEFAESDGMKQISPGFYATQQKRMPFGFSYRTMIGNDLEGTEHGYKIHLVYNCTASPAPRNNSTVAGNSSIPTRSWTFNTVPPPGLQFKPTAHVVLDSRYISAAKMSLIEDTLYGRTASGSLSDYPPTLVSIGQIAAFLAA